MVGLLTMLVSIEAAQNGHWSITARVATAVIGVCAGPTQILLIIYNWLLARVRKLHDLEMDGHNMTTVWRDQHMARTRRCFHMLQKGCAR